MYKVKGPSKLVAKTTRRGISQNIDNYKENRKEKIEDDINNLQESLPKLVFQKKHSVNQQNKQHNMSPEQLEIVNYIHKTWLSVYSELEEYNNDPNGTPRTLYYDAPIELPKDFIPVDLEALFADTLLAQVTAAAENSKQ